MSPRSSLVSSRSDGRFSSDACSTRQRNSCQVTIGWPSTARTSSPARSAATAAALPAGGAPSRGFASGSPYMKRPA